MCPLGLLLVVTVLTRQPASAPAAKAPPARERTVPAQPDHKAIPLSGHKPMMPPGEVLKARGLLDAKLSEEEGRKYRAALAQLVKPRDARPAKRAPRAGRENAKPAANGGAAGAPEKDPPASATQLFGESVVHLQYHQELAAADAMKAAWAAAVDTWNNRKAVNKDLTMIRDHFAMLHALYGRDNPLLLAYLQDLDDAYVIAISRLRQLRHELKPFLPLATLWVRLGTYQKLDAATQENAGFWALGAPNEVFVDGPLDNSVRARYELELASFRSVFNTPPAAPQLQALGFTNSQIFDYTRAYDRRQQLLGRPGQYSEPLPLDGRQIEQELNLFETVTKAQIRFGEAAIHVKYGQYRRAVEAYRDGTTRFAVSGRVDLRTDSNASIDMTRAFVRDYAIVVARQVREVNPFLGALFENTINPKQ